MTRIDYAFLDGDFERVPLKKLPKRIARELCKHERREERATERSSNYLDGGGYCEGESEAKIRQISYSNPVAEAADRNALERMVYEALTFLNSTQRRRVWLYAQGYTLAEIAQMESISEEAARKSVKLAKKKIKRIMEKGLGFSDNLWGYK